MKKFTTLVMGLTAVFALTACGGKGKEVKAEDLEKKAAEIEDHEYSQATIKYSYSGTMKEAGGEEEKVEAFAEEKGIDIIARIPRSDDITRCEDIGKTCVEGAPESEAAQEFIKLAQKLLSEESK